MRRRGCCQRWSRLNTAVVVAATVVGHEALVSPDADEGLDKGSKRFGVGSKLPRRINSGSCLKECRCHQRIPLHRPSMGSLRCGSTGGESFGTRLSRT